MIVVMTIADGGGSVVNGQQGENDDHRKIAKLGMMLVMAIHMMMIRKDGFGEDASNDGMMLMMLMRFSFCDDDDSP